MYVCASYIHVCMCVRATYMYVCASCIHVCVCELHTCMCVYMYVCASYIHVCVYICMYSSGSDLVAKELDASPSLTCPQVLGSLLRLDSKGTGNLCCIQPFSENAVYACCCFYCNGRLVTTCRGQHPKS